MIQILHNLALFGFKNANFFAEFFGENVLKIMTSVPGTDNTICKLVTLIGKCWRFGLKTLPMPLFIFLKTQTMQH
jgi:hypothetical protein